MSKKQTKIKTIQSIRAIAFLGILCQHCSLIQLGTWGVTVFFALSGFILTYQYYEKSLGQSWKERFIFAIHKVKKLYPVHVLTTLAVGILELYSLYIDGNFREAGKVLRNMLIHLLLISDWFMQEDIKGTLNGVDWFLSAIFLLYFLFPILLRQIQKYHKPGIAMKTLGITLFVQIMISCFIGHHFKNVYYFTYFFPPYRLFEFWIGCNAGYIFTTSEKKLSKNEATLLEAVAIGAVIISVAAQFELSERYLPPWVKNSILYIPSTIGVLILFSMENGIFSKILRNSWLVYLGDISGYTFLIHQTVLYYSQAVYFKFMGKSQNNYYFQMIIVLILTVGCTELYLLLQKKLVKRD